jgi:hypothetical protein
MRIIKKMFENLPTILPVLVMPFVLFLILSPSCSNKEPVSDVFESRYTENELDSIEYVSKEKRTDSIFDIIKTKYEITLILDSSFQTTLDYQNYIEKSNKRAILKHFRIKDIFKLDGDTIVYIKSGSSLFDLLINCNDFMLKADASTLEKIKANLKTRKDYFINGWSSDSLNFVPVFHIEKIVINPYKENSEESDILWQPKYKIERIEGTLTDIYEINN